MSTNSLEGKVAVVTGGAGGLGTEECIELARHGASVVVSDVGSSVGGDGSDQLAAQKVVDEIKGSGGSAVAHGGDVSTWDGAQSAIDLALETWGRLDVVVNGAGILRDKMIFNMTEDDWDSVIAVHLKHTFAMTRHACVVWREQAKRGEPVAGRIINTTSGAGLVGNPGQANYGAAKAAIAGFTVIVAQEMLRYGVTVNAISPLARTRMTQGIPGAVGDGEAGYDPYDPANVAPLVAYLASDDAGWITGQVLRIEGGKLGRYEGWHIVAGATKADGRFEFEELPLELRRLFGAYPRDIRAALG